MGRPSKYPAEFREQAVELVRASEKTIAEIARDLQINDTTLGNWVRADQAERGVPDGAWCPAVDRSGAGRAGQAASG
jgi:transposase